MGGWMAHKDGALGALLVVEDELDGDVGLAGPCGVRRVAAVADEVTRVPGCWG